MRDFEVIGGGVPSAEEAAAIAAALAVVLAQEPPPPPSDRWRWSGRPAWPERRGRSWEHEAADWRDPGSSTHPSFP